MNGMLLWASLLSKAQAAQFYMWGVGPTAQTHIYPFGYPLALPTTSVEGANPKDNLQSSSYIFGAGAKFVAYINPMYRASFRPVYSFGDTGSGYSAISASIEVDRTVMNQNGIQVYFGAGLGTGGFRSDQGDSGVLTGRTLFARGHAGGMMLSGSVALELAVFTELGFVGEEKYVHNDEIYNNGGWFNSDETGSLGWGVYYPVFGLEATAYFGKFVQRTPRKRKKRRRRR